MGIASAYNITDDQLTGQDGLLLAVADDGTLHGNVTLQAGDDVGSLLFLIVTNEGVEQQDAENDTEIDPVIQATSKQSSKFHDCRSHTSAIVFQLANLSGSLVVWRGSQVDARWT